MLANISVKKVGEKEVEITVKSKSFICEKSEFNNLAKLSEMLEVNDIDLNGEESSRIAKVLHDVSKI